MNEENDFDNILFSQYKLSNQTRIFNLYSLNFNPFDKIINQTMYINQSLQPIIDSINRISDQVRPNQLLIDSVKNNIEQVTKSFDISSLLSKAIVQLPRIDFENILKAQDEGKKRSLSIMLQYDWYIPLNFLDFFKYAYMIDSQKEADELVAYFLEELNQKNISLYDIIPKSLDNYQEVDKLKTLLELNYKKLAVLHCLERIESAIVTTQYDASKLSQLKISNRGYSSLIDKVEINGDLTKEILTNLTEVGTNIRLFERFSNLDKEFDSGEISLNRNLFMHGLVKENQITDKLVNQAIFAWIFFEILKKSLDKKQPKRRVGISRRNQLKKRYHK